jgi:hypothetical protein
MSPTNALAHARLALSFLKEMDSQDESRWQTADFLSRRALQLAPDDSEVKHIRREIENRMRLSTNDPIAIR